MRLRPLLRGIYDVNNFNLDLRYRAKFPKSIVLPRAGFIGTLMVEGYSSVITFITVTKIDVPFHGY